MAFWTTVVTTGAKLYGNKRAGDKAEAAGKKSNEAVRKANEFAQQIEGIQNEQARRQAIRETIIERSRIRALAAVSGTSGSSAEAGLSTSALTSLEVGLGEQRTIGLLRDEKIKQETRAGAFAQQAQTEIARGRRNAQALDTVASIAGFFEEDQVIVN